jgi:hypothetical protein
MSANQINRTARGERQNSISGFRTRQIRHAVGFGSSSRTKSKIRLLDIPRCQHCHFCKVIGME